MKEAKKFLDRVLIALFISVWVFILLMSGIFVFMGDVPNELIIGFFSIFGVEGIACAVITIAKNIIKHKLKISDDFSEEECE